MLLHSKTHLDYNKNSLAPKNLLNAPISPEFSPVKLVTSNDADGSNSNPLDQLSVDQIQSPKRQYFIAPRIGRTSWPASISVSARDFNGLNDNQIKSSLLYLLGESRRPRSSGLFPQARVGRRAAPSSGLMPLPRIGRSGNHDSIASMGLGGEQEIALATINDNSLGDALETLMNAQTA